MNPTVGSAPETTATPPARAARRGIPLRVSLVALTLALVVVGLLTSGIAVTSAMRADLIGRLDASLIEATNTWAIPGPGPFSSRERSRGPRGEGPGPRRPPSNFYVRVDFSGESLVTSDYAWTPNLSSLPVVDTGPRTVASTGTGPDWRVIQRISPTDQSARIVVATPLADVDATMSRLIWLQVGIGSVVVLMLGGAGYLLVNSSLRPLRRVEETAHAIAGGDLDRRVPEMRPGTEVASLADSINGMLAQIQTAFAATEASEQQARASEERMRRFIADASHELRTPLTSIKGFSELIRGDMMPDPADGVRRISAEADRMSMLVEDLLMLARLDSQRPLTTAPVMLSELVRDAAAAARAAAPDREIIVEDQTRDPGPVVDGESPRLMQVLRNLIGNAIMHTPAGTPISVVVSEETGQARVDVVDQGPGLSAEDAQRVFERFFRGDSSRHRETAAAGSGLGLSIVAALIEAHGGRVGVTTGPGQGARFWFVLPTVRARD
ncbi:MAG: HAMP domain-containing sensor histidine kinase [Gordonia sp. (in: high G+C Gram-positive bacteria)]|uniref:sensor histidine kinase n=1 Tax=Gordonia sp. (in: high G+C Gram-positive bacteria) TaxID=84139 RepID=UPI003BB5EF24